MIKAFFKAAAITSVSLTACNNSETRQSETASLDCPQIKGVASLLANDGPEIIVVGEIHGQEEPPAFVDALVCHSLESGKQTVLALEMFDEDGNIANYLKSDGGPDAQEKLFDNWMWKAEFTDGRSSMAMLNLIDSAREKTQAYSNLNVVTFQSGGGELEGYRTRNARSQAHEKIMADKILKGAAKWNAEKTIVLVGNLHARRGKNTRGDYDYEFMANHMPAPKTMTFNTIYTNGTSWNCRGPKPTDCGSNKSGGVVDSESELGRSQIYTVIDGTDEAAIAPFLGRQYGPEFYDGVIYVGQANASPPANKDGRVPFYADDK